jgi:hypothetical protein
MPRKFLQSIAGFSSPRGHEVLKHRPVVTKEDLLTEIPLRLAIARDDALLRQGEASGRSWEGHHRECDHSPTNNLSMIASLGILGVFLIIFADLHVLGLI